MCCQCVVWTKASIEALFGWDGQLYLNRVVRSWKHCRLRVWLAPGQRMLNLSDDAQLQISRSRWRCWRRWWWNACRCVGSHGTLTRFIIGQVMCRNDIVLRHCRSADVEIGHSSQCSKQVCGAKCAATGKLCASVDAVSCKVRLAVRIPRQCRAPSRGAPEDQSYRDGANPTCQATQTVHSDPRLECTSLSMQHQNEMLR